MDRDRGELSLSQIYLQRKRYFRSVATKCDLLIIYSYTYIFLSVRAVLKLSKLQVEWTSFLQYTELQAVILLQQSSRAANTD